MTKSLLMGMMVCMALATFAGNADARRASIHMKRIAPALSSLRAKGGPLHDCVHVTFPQCDGHSYGGGPND